MLTCPETLPTPFANSVTPPFSHSRHTDACPWYRRNHRHILLDARRHAPLSAVSDPASLYRIWLGQRLLRRGGPQDTGECTRIRCRAVCGLRHPSLSRSQRSRLVPIVKACCGPKHRSSCKGASRRIRDRQTTSRFSGFVRLRDVSSRRPMTFVGLAGHGYQFTAWQIYWGADAAAIGSGGCHSGQPFTIVGRGSSGFFGDTLRSDRPIFGCRSSMNPSSTVRISVTAISFRMAPRHRKAEAGATPKVMSARLAVVLRRWAGARQRISTRLDRNSQAERAVIAAGNGVEEMREDYGPQSQILLSVCGLVPHRVREGRESPDCARMARRTQTPSAWHWGFAAATHFQWLVESILLAIAGGMAACSSPMPRKR